MATPWFSINSMFCGCAAAPPPSAITMGRPRATPRTRACSASLSMRRKASSPRESKMSAIERCWLASMSWSISAKLQPSRSASSLPIVVLPEAMKPIRYRPGVCFSFRITWPHSDRSSSSALPPGMATAVARPPAPILRPGSPRCARCVPHREPPLWRTARL